MCDGFVIGGALHNFGRTSNSIAIFERIKAVIQHDAHLAENFQAGASQNSQPPTPRGFVVVFSVGDGGSVRLNRTDSESLIRACHGHDFRADHRTRVVGEFRQKQP
jgi:hypothetical protein